MPPSSRRKWENDGMPYTDTLRALVAERELEIARLEAEERA